LTEDISQDLRFQSGAHRLGDRVRSVMCVPLLSGTSVQGVIYVDRTQNLDPFTEDDLRFLTVIGNQVAINLANASLFEEVLTEKQKVQGVISSLKDGLVIADQDLVVQSCNAAAADILFAEGGYPVGKNLLKLLLARDTNLDEAEVRRSLREGKDFNLLAARGTEVRAYAVSVASLSPGEEGRGGFVLSFRDTTDLLHLQELKSEFIRNASHKLRTPLTILLGNVDILRSLPPGEPSPETIRELIHGMEKNIRQLEGLVSRFLEFAELDRTHFKLREVNLREAAALAEAGIVSRAQEKSIQLLNQIPESAEMRVLGDTDRLVQCLFNILDNAVKFAPESSAVRIYSDEGDEWIRLHIEDEGPGIPSTDLSDIFSGFHQVEKMPTGEVPGAGLGLTIAKRIIHTHSGSITAMSPPPNSQRGTLITISLPRPGVPQTRNPRSPEVLQPA
ncbi:MAG: ATP-binding protein, partial [Thermoanaerobaculia bacterium]